MEEEFSRVFWTSFLNKLIQWPTRMIILRNRTFFWNFFAFFGEEIVITKAPKTWTPWAGGQKNGSFATHFFIWYPAGYRYRIWPDGYPTTGNKAGKELFLQRPKTFYLKNLVCCCIFFKTKTFKKKVCTCFFSGTVTGIYLFKSEYPVYG